MARRRNLAGRLVSILVAAALMVWLLRLVSPRELLGWLVRMDPLWLAVYVLLSLAGLVVRALRYRLLLGGGPGLGDLFWVAAIRNLFVDLLPARSGALSYVYVLQRRFRVPAATGAGTMVMAMLLDYLAFAPMIAAALAVSAAEMGLPTGPLALAAALLLASSAVLLAAMGGILRACRAGIAALATRLRQGWRSRLGILEEALGRVLADLERLKADRGSYPRLILLSLLVRAGKYAALYFLLLAVMAPRGWGLSSLDFGRVLLGYAGAELSSALPFHGPGGLGTWEAAWTISFTALGYDLKTAAATGMAVHLAGKVLEFLLGAAGIALVFGRRP